MRKQVFTIQGTLLGFEQLIQLAKGPGGAQRYSKAKAAAELNIGYELLAQKIQPLESPALLMFEWVEPDMRRDKDNIAGGGVKQIIDAMRKSKILKNDGWRYVTGFGHEFAVNAKQPHIRVTIIEMA